MNKYIVNNCPCFIDFDEQSLFENLCKNGGSCYDCTDCVVKQIVQVCNEYSDKWEDCDFSNGLSNEIFKLLDMEIVR